VKAEAVKSLKLWRGKEDGGPGGAGADLPRQNVAAVVDHDVGPEPPQRVSEQP